MRRDGSFIFVGWPVNDPSLIAARYESSLRLTA
jgi:hypothetical protein